MASNGIIQRTLNHINENIHLLEIDVEKGIIHNRKSFMSGGYLSVQLKGRTIKVHHIICIAGGLNLLSGLSVNHINGDKLDNQLTNLEVVTHSENMQHMYDTGLKRPKKGTELSYTKLNEELVVYVKRQINQGAVIRELAKELGVGEASLYDIKRGKTWSHIKA